MNSPYCVSIDDISDTTLVPKEHLKGGSVGAKIAYGRDSSISVATRKPGYHSKPHCHDSEQLNFVIEGELYIFVENEGFLAKKGDLFRIPKNATHWSWVQGSTDCVLLSCYSPSLLDSGFLETAVPLLTEAERAAPVSSVSTVYPGEVDVSSVERKVMALSAS